MPCLGSEHGGPCHSFLQNVLRDGVECVMHVAFLSASYFVHCLLIWVSNGLKMVG